MKPDDISPAAMKAAYKLWNDLAQSKSTTKESDASIIAFAIQAAKLEAYQEAAKVAEDMSNPYKSGARGVAQEQGRAISEAIKSLGNSG